MASHDLAVLSLLDLSDEEFLFGSTPEPVIKPSSIKSKKHTQLTRNNKSKQNKKRNSLKNDKISSKSSDKKTGEKLRRNSKKLKEKQNKNRNSNSTKIVHKKRHSNSSTNSDENIQKTLQRESDKIKRKKTKSPLKSASKPKSKRLSIKMSKENINVNDIKMNQQNIKKLSKSSKTSKPSKPIKSASISKLYTKSTSSNPSKAMNKKPMKSSKSVKSLKRMKSGNKSNKSSKLKVPKSSKPPRATHLAAKSRKSDELMMIKSDRPRSKSPQPANDDNKTEEDEEEEDEEEKKEIIRARSKSPQPIKAAMDMMDKETLHRLYDNYKRKKWKIGSKVEVFSVSQSLWIKGKVIRICNDLQGEWLTIMYSDNCTQKTLSRNDDDIRPIINNNDDNNNDKEKMAKLISENIKNTKSKNNNNNKWYVGQKCEIKDAAVGWTWCEILEIFQDLKGKFMTIEYKIYGKERRYDGAQYKRCQIEMGFKGIKARIPQDISPYLATKWESLSERINNYPIESVEEHMNARDIELTSMVEIFKKFNNNIKTYNDIPIMIEQLIDAQNIKLLPILIIDLENTLIPYKLIKNIMYKNNINSMKQLFLNLNHWIYDSNYKFLKELQRILRETAEIMNIFINNFRGKIIIYAEGGYSVWNNLINYIPESGGGDLWRDIYKKSIINNNKGISIYSAQSAYIKERKEENININNINNIINSKQLILERYLKSIQMEMEYGRFKNETYFIPIIFVIGDDKTDINSSKNSVQKIFKKFYRLIQFHLINNNNININNIDITQKSLRNCLNDTNIQYFINKDISNKTFKKQTWFQLFNNNNNNNKQYTHQLIQY